MALPAESDRSFNDAAVANQTWERCLNIIKDQISTLSFKTWFQPIVPIKLIGNDLSVQVPSQFFYDWLEEHYDGLIQNTISSVMGQSGRLCYLVASEDPSSV